MWRAIRFVFVGALFLALLILAGSFRLFRFVTDVVHEYGGDLIGRDPKIEWLIAVAAFALVRMIPWRFLVVAPLTGSPKPLIALIALALTGAATLMLINERRRQTDPNDYRDSYTGEFKVWFEKGTCTSHDRDGYDDRGNRYEQATPEKVETCEKVKAESEKQTVAEQKQRLREQQVARRSRFEDIGVYHAVGRYVTIDGFRFFLEEVVVLRQEIQIKFRVVNLRDEEARSHTSSRFEFGLATNEGWQIPAASVQRVHGNITVAANGLLLVPDAGDKGWIVVTFKRDSESGGFGLVINHAIAFNRPAAHVVNFRKF